jgi:hypothetical protein
LPEGLGLLFFQKNLAQVLGCRGGGRVTRLAIVAAAISHPWDVYAQMIEYLSTKRIDPHSAH